MPTLEFVHTQFTDHVIPRPEALLHAEETYRTFARVDFDNATKLARFSILLSSPHEMEKMTYNELGWFYAEKFISAPEVPYNDHVTLKGLVAINMIGVDRAESDMELYLREPFKELEVLDMLHNSKSNSIWVPSN